MELKKLYKEVEQTLSPERLEQLVKPTKNQINRLMNDLEQANTLYDLAYIYRSLSSQYLTLDLLTLGTDTTARLNAKSYEMKAKKIEELSLYCSQYEEADDEFDAETIEKVVKKINETNDSIPVNTNEPINTKMVDMYALKNSIMELCDKFENEIKNYNK